MSPTADAPGPAREPPPNPVGPSPFHDAESEPGKSSQGRATVSDCRPTNLQSGAGSRREAAPRHGADYGSAAAPGAGCSYRAVTVVVMPPRTEKSPTTTMRRGEQAATRSSRIWFVRRS